MSSIESLRSRVRREAVEPAGQASERVSKLADECGRLNRAARTVLDGAGGSVGSDVPTQIAKAQQALENAKKSLIEARNRANSYEKLL